MEKPAAIPQVMPWLGDEEAAAAAKTITENWITEGPRCNEFSSRLLELIGAPHGVFAPNGTLALALALMAIGVGPGDEVLTPDITFIASANAAIMVGAVPIFVDVDLSNRPRACRSSRDLAHSRNNARPPLWHRV